MIFLGACYLYIYIPNNEKIVQERRFRCLQNIDNNIHSKIDNSLSQVNSLLIPYNHPNYKKDTLDKYLKDYAKDNFTLIPVKKLAGKERDIFVAGTDSSSSITVDSNSRQIILSVSRNLKSQNPQMDSLYSMGIKFGFEQFITPLLPADIFDNYIVFSHKKVVFETFPSGLSYKTKDSLLEVKNGIAGPGVRSLNVGGTDYKVFSQPVNFGTNTEWIVTGLVSNKNYQKEKTQLPLWLSMLLLTGAITLIVALPWIKLYQMGNKDKLTITDGVCSILVSMLLMSLLFFIFFKYNLYLSPDRSSNSRNTLANNVTVAFTKDWHAAYNTLTSFDSVYKNKANTDIVNLNKPGITYSKKNIDTDVNITLNTLAKQMSVIKVFWLEKNGKEKHSWTIDKVNTPHSNFSSRDYFKRIINNKPYWYAKREFYLDQVISRTTGVFTTVIAMPSKSDSIKVAAMSFDLKSLINVVMPDGYMFAIIDTNGKVHYHSITARNLNENLKSEFADSSKLVSCLQAKSDTFFNAEYFGKPYIIKIKPIEGLPYFMVIFEDSSYNDTRDTEVYSFTIAMLMCLLVFLVSQFIVLFLVSSKRSFFKNRLFETAWIGPKITSHREYNQAILSNGAIIALLIIFFKFTSFLGYLYILLFSITYISIILNSIFAVKYKEHNPYNYHFKIIVVQWLCLFVAVLDYAAWKTLDLRHFLVLILFELLSVGACMVICKLSPYLLEKARNFKHKRSIDWVYTQSFSLMATTRLIITSGIPVILFFTYSYNYEQNLSTRYKQLIFVNALTQKIPQRTITESKIKAARGIFCDGTFIKDIKIDSGLTIDAAYKKSISYSREDSLTVDILRAFRFYKGGKAVKDNNLNLSWVGTRMSFNHLLRDECDNNRGTIIHRQIGFPHKFIIISSATNINYQLPIPLFWIILIAAIIVFYYAIDNIIRKLFSLNLPSTDGWEKIDEKILLSNKLNKLVFIVGSPGSGKLSKFKEKLNSNQLFGNNGELLILDEKEPSQNNVFVADMILINPEAGEADPNWKDCREKALNNDSMVIINHFEYNIKDATTNTIKLNFLESLMQRGKSKIIVISTVHPVSFLNSFNEQASKSISNDQTNRTIRENDLERWHVLLGHFRIVIERLEASDIPNDVSMLNKAIMEETQYTHFLHKMQGTLLKVPSQLGEQNTSTPDSLSDSLIFKLQLTSQYFYTYIWQSLTQEEKFLLYDLAEDGLVNSYDDYNLSMLISKGLIIRVHGTLMLFNKGFRNFILTAIGNKEVERIKNLVKDNGNWASLKTPLILVIIAILVFLFASQQEAYSRIITYVTALGAGIPAVLKIFSLFGNGNSNQKPSS